MATRAVRQNHPAAPMGRAGTFRQAGGESWGRDEPEVPNGPAGPGRGLGPLCGRPMVSTTPLPLIRWTRGKDGRAAPRSPSAVWMVTRRACVSARRRDRDGPPAGISHRHDGGCRGQTTSVSLLLSGGRPGSPSAGTTPESPSAALGDRAERPRCLGRSGPSSTGHWALPVQVSGVQAGGGNETNGVPAMNSTHGLRPSWRRSPAPAGSPTPRSVRWWRHPLTPAAREPDLQTRELVPVPVRRS
ncbi:hypothetical protein IW245_000474 [Longispora fulva]|uniref:Uncharacterized protein n=1 Tax=Longispora fulva TaxID=619741 RepID=A0A8J7KDQ1_9ACTN|nr:hypothetical protein [Longispora fulva]